MKPIIKLLFVALLIGVTLSLPSKVRASSGQYVCTSQFPECYIPAESVLGQCMNGCMNGSGGPGSQLCWGTMTEVNYQDGYYFYDVEQICDTVPNGSVSCAQECLNNFYAVYTPCQEEFCSYQ